MSTVGKNLEQAWLAFILLLRAGFSLVLILVGLFSLAENVVAGLLTILIGLFLILLWQVADLKRRRLRQFPPTGDRTI